MQEKVLASAKLGTYNVSVLLNSYGDAVFYDGDYGGTRIVKVDKAVVHEYYVDTKWFCDDDDDAETLREMMTGIAICKLFDGMRKFVRWEEV